MKFLCASHRQHYGQLAENDLAIHWESWMHQAGSHYRDGAWEEALTFAGSAYDLAKIRLDRPRTKLVAPMARLTLSAIYTANIMQHQGSFCEGRNILALASDCLQCFTATNEADKAQELMACLENELIRDQMIEGYLNLPYRPANYPVYSARVH